MKLLTNSNVTNYHIVDMRHKKIAEILSGLTRQLSGHVINATNKHTITTEALHIRVILGIV